MLKIKKYLKLYNTTTSYQKQLNYYFFGVCVLCYWSFEFSCYFKINIIGFELFFLKLYQKMKNLKIETIIENQKLKNRK